MVIGVTVFCHFCYFPIAKRKETMDLKSCILGMFWWSSKKKYNATLSLDFACIYWALTRVSISNSTLASATYTYLGWTVTIHLQLSGWDGMLCEAIILTTVFNWHFSLIFPMVSPVSFLSHIFHSASDLPR